MSGSMDPIKEAEEAVEAKRDLLERIADEDLPISEDIERIVELATEGTDGD